MLGYTASLWRRQPGMVGATTLAMLAATAADLTIPIFAGRMIDAVAMPDREAGRALAVAALAAMAVLGALMIIGRHLAFLGIIRVTTRMMREAASPSLMAEAVLKELAEKEAAPKTDTK